MLDGVAGVNVSEPRAGDLERVIYAYAECRKERDSYARALEMALREGIFTNKRKVRYGLLERILSKLREAVK